MSLHSEIMEQPAVLARLLDEGREPITKIAHAIRERDIQYVLLAARGTSDNAGRYAVYLWGAHNQLPVALSTPSLFTYYQQPPKLKNALVVGISQSGKSPDIVSVLDEGKRQGALTLAITNAPNSPLASAADLSFDILAGVESAVAATKTYTASLMAVAMLSAALADNHPQRWDELRQVPIWVQAALAQDDELSSQAQRYRYMEHCVVMGRGFNYATAFEWSLKLKELTYTVAEPYSSADFLHGPIAMVGQGFPVLAAVPSGAVYPSLMEVFHQLKEQQLSELVLISDNAEALALAHTPIPLPAGIPEWLSPIVAITPAQLFAYHLTRARGYNTEAPRSIRKITETH